MKVNVLCSYGGKSGIMNIPDKDAKELLRIGWAELIEDEGQSDDEVDFADLAKDYIASQTDKIDEVLAKVDLDKLKAKKDGTLDANSQKYLNKLIEDEGQSDD